MATVFWFRTLNPETGEHEEAPKKATEETIERLGGEKIWGSAEEVDDAAVDADGFYASPFGP
jgi:hypothetical protein